MSSKRPRTLVSTTSSSNHASSSVRKRRRDPAKDTPSDLSQLDVVVSPDVTLEQPTPTHPVVQWPHSMPEDEVEHGNPGSREAISRPLQSQLPSNTSSSSASTSAADSDSGPDSDSSTNHYLPNQVSDQILSPFPTTAQMHPLVASLRSSQSRSPSRRPQSPVPSFLGSLAPSLYNRSPSPFSPSPSLKSFLQPSFSNSTSRPITPDELESDSFFGSSTTPLPGAGAPDTHLLSPTNVAQTLPRANPKVPTYEYYGFALYLTSSAAFLGYILWSYLPSTVLHMLGIYYYPDRWWSLAIPAWVVVAVAFVYVALAAYNSEVLTLSLGSLGAVVDEVGVVAVVDRNGKLVGKGQKHDLKDKVGDWHWRDAWSHSTDAVLDVPVGGVCEVLYGDG